jgi:hypothetical protein
VLLCYDGLERVTRVLERDSVFCIGAAHGAVLCAFGWAFA